MLKLNNNQKPNFRWRGESGTGFTIIEMTVVLAFVAVFAFLLSYLAIFQFSIYNTQNTSLTIAADARNTADDVDNYVRQAHQVLSSYSTYSTGGQTLVLQVPSIDNSNQIISGSYDTVVFYLSGTDFYRKVFPDASSSRLAATKKLAANIDTSNFSISYNNASFALVTEVTSNIAIKQTVAGRIKSITFSSAATLRNY